MVGVVKDSSVGVYLVHEPQSCRPHGARFVLFRSQACVGNETWNWPTNFTDSVLWNGMIVPLLRTVHSGAIWYQGENNVCLGLKACLFSPLSCSNPSHSELATLFSLYPVLWR